VAHDTHKKAAEHYEHAEKAHHAVAEHHAKGIMRQFGRRAVKDMNTPPRRTGVRLKLIRSQSHISNFIL
jgi:hypothetical protein